MRKIPRWILSVMLAVAFVVAVPARATDVADVQATVNKWVANFNKGDMKAFVAACAPHAAIVDGFPPYAWQTCADWIHDYEVNNQTTRGTDGTLWIGKIIYSEVSGDRAYVIYPATFTNKQQGKTVVYKGTWNMTLLKTESGWVFTGSASAWGTNSL